MMRPTSLTCSSLTTTTDTTFERAATSATDSAAVPPRSTSSATAAGRTSNTASWKPARSIERAIAPPMLPTPTMPICSSPTSPMSHPLHPRSNPYSGTDVSYTTAGSTGRINRTDHVEVRVTTAGEGERDSVVVMGCGDVGPYHEPLDGYPTLAKPTLATADIRFAHAEKVYSDCGVVKVHSSGHYIRAQR